MTLEDGSATSVNGYGEWRASLVIPVYKGWDYLEALLSSLTPLPSWLQVVVVDDFSADGRAELFRAAHEEVQLLIRPTNGGFAAAVNTGLAAAVSEVLIVANSDLQMDLLALEGMVEAVEKWPMHVIGPRTVRANGAEIQTAHRFPTVAGDTAELFIPYRLFRHLRAKRRGSPKGKQPAVRCDWVVGSCLAFSRHTWARAGEFDVGYGMYSEEVDWQWRASRAGITGLFLPTVTVVHDETHGVRRGDEAAERRFRAVWRARVRYFERTAGEPTVAKLRCVLRLARSLNTPLWLLIGLIPSLRSDAAAERRRLAWLVNDCARSD